MSRSISDLSVEEEIKVQHIKPIGGNTLPTQYSREISGYQPSDKEKAKAMKDALSAVRQFTSEGNLSKNGNLNTTTMRRCGIMKIKSPSQVKPKVLLKKSQKNPRMYNQYPKLNANYVVETMKLINAPMRVGLVD